MTRKLSRFSAICVLSLCAVLSSGCSINGLWRNIWSGFGYSLGGLPAQFLIDALLVNNTTTTKTTNG